MSWVLKDGKHYYWQMSAIGPMRTARKAQAMRFDSKEEAMRSPAYSFWATSYEPVEVKR